MNILRQNALESLLGSLTNMQLSQVRLIIETAEVQRDYGREEKNSGWSDDANETLGILAQEFNRGEWV